MAEDEHEPGPQRMVVVAGVILLVLLGCAGSLLLLGRGIRAVTSLPPEYDGTRPLVGSYELVMLKGHPRCIHLIDKTLTVPADADWHSTTQLNRYAVVGTLIVGRVDPRGPGPPSLADPAGPESRYFVLDTETDTAAYTSTSSSA